MSHGKGICKCHSKGTGYKLKASHGPGLCNCPKHQTRVTKYRDDFLAFYGSGPYPCGGKKGGCGEPVSFEECDVDHVDNDKSNNDPANWQPMHHRCHAAKSRGDDSPENAAARSARMVAINADPAIRAARSERAKAQWAAGNLGRKAKA